MVYDSMTRIKGLIAATLTPFDDGGELNLSVIEVYAQHLQNENVKGLFVAGTTGESTLLTVEERKILAEKWIEVGKDRFEHIIIHVGTSNLKDSQELARHSENNRATAIALMATSFFTPKSVVLMEDFLKAAIPKIPTLAGVKFTSGDMFDLGRCLILEDQRFSIMFGGDEILISALAMGACASVGGTYNFAGKLHFRIMDAFDKGDMETARSEQYRSQAMVKLYCKYGGHAGVGKAIMRFLGLDLGPARSPLSLSESQEAQLRDELGNIGFFTWR
ncbi:N-acetylneuraminate lyase-like isoform X2 [Pocillopora damicornis]|uniref:N-acetylneuraminate lyase-like isoform X2 n=1 Tax=Pocillopora damicornis TaxID=46731 RepID=UPI000F555490|nr:N-acetylneuraminate lyase-like isoform X2 [Pocillopora damicornis]